MKITKNMIGASFYFAGDWQTPGGRFTIATEHANPKQYDCLDERGILWEGFRGAVVDAALVKEPANNG